MGGDIMSLVEYARLKRHIDKRFDGIYSVLRAGELITTWAGVQGVVRAGLADKFFSIGDQFVATFNGQPVVWDVIGIDHDKPTDPRFTHSLTIQSRDILLTAQFDAPEPDNPNSDRQQYGNNRYIHSAIRQWLNSEEEEFTWQPQHEYDAPPTGAPYDGPGFLKLLDPELVAVLGAVDKQVARNVVDGGGQDLFSDKVFLLSSVEIYSVGGGTSGEAPYPYYESLAPSPTGAALDGRIKYLGDSARQWLLRSPSPGLGGAGSPLRVSSNGGTGSSPASGFNGVAPAVVIV